MIRRLVDQAFNSGKYYISAVGLSTDVKPTEGIITGSKFVEVDTGIGYLFDETSGEWHKNQQLTEAVQAYFEDHPEAIDQAAIEAMFGDQLDGIEEDIGGLKSALIESDTKNIVYETIWKNKGNNFVEGYLNSSGMVASSNDAYVSDFFRVEKDEPIIIRMDDGYSGSSIHVCFYDSNKSLVNYYSVSMDRRKCIGKTAPSTAVYCRFDYLKAFPNPTAEQTITTNIVPLEKNTPSVVQGDIKILPKVIGSLDIVDFVTGWLTTTGGINGNEAKTSKYIKLLNSNPLLKFGSSVPTTNIQIAFYDANLTFVQYMANKDASVAIPNGAVYFSYTIDDSWTDANLTIAQNQSIAVPTEQQLAVQGVQTGLPLNIKYRGLLAGFGNSERKLRVFSTKNFDYFEQIGETFAPTKGNKACRDPFIIVYKNYFYIFYTDTPSFTTNNNDIGVCRTKDFITYEELDPIICNANFKVCWAPFVFEENGNYYLTITGSTLNYSETYTYMYDLDMDTLTISNERVIEVGTSTRQLDFQFIKNNGKYYAIGKYDNTATTVIGISDSLDGSYTVIANQRYCNKPEEGQHMMRLDDGSWRLYVNDYSIDQVIHYVDIPDIANPTENVGALKTISSDSPVNLFHVYIMDFNRPYSFEEC